MLLGIRSLAAYTHYKQQIYLLLVEVPSYSCNLAFFWLVIYAVVVSFVLLLENWVLMAREALLAAVAAVRHLGYYRCWNCQRSRLDLFQSCQVLLWLTCRLRVKRIYQEYHLPPNLLEMNALISSWISESLRMIAVQSQPNHCKIQKAIAAEQLRSDHIMIESLRIAAELLLLEYLHHRSFAINNTSL